MASTLFSGNQHGQRRIHFETILMDVRLNRVAHVKWRAATIKAFVRSEDELISCITRYREEPIPISYSFVQ